MCTREWWKLSILVFCILPCGCLSFRAYEDNKSSVLEADRLFAEEQWRRGIGLLWFQHFRRAGGTSLCSLLKAAVPEAEFLVARGQACQPEEWVLRDAVAICEHNLTLVGEELWVQGGNAFAQEYGPIPGPFLVGSRFQRYILRNWVFVATLRHPWSRFWSQVKYELSACLLSADALMRCVSGNFQSLGMWWSPTAHIDSVLGVPEARIAPVPALYVDNYYTRILLNRTDVRDGPLDQDDLDKAIQIIESRASAIIITENFAASALQLACALDLDLNLALPFLQTKVRPYEANERMMIVPQDELQFGEKNIQAIKTKFAYKNSIDYALYQHAKVLSLRRLRKCARARPDVAEVMRNPPPPPIETEKPSPKEGDPLESVDVDDLFGCSGGSVEMGENNQYVLKCPRSAAQQSNSWWSSIPDGETPKRKRGQKLPGQECWAHGFSWATCCAKKFGPKGNEDCWDAEYTYKRCCRQIR